MTLEEFRALPLFKSLRPALQRFLLVYVETRDKRKAGYVGWNCTTDISAYNSSQRALLNPVVRELISVYTGVALKRPLTREELIDLIGSRLRRPDLSSREFGSLIERYCDLQGWGEVSPVRLADPLHASYVGKYLRGQDGKEYDKRKREEKGEPDKIDMMALVRQLESEEEAPE